MSETLALKSYGFAELSSNELLTVDGGVDWNTVGLGAGIAMGAIVGIMTAPTLILAVPFLGFAYLGGYIAGVGAKA